jgi:hypothetical protein
VGGGVGAPTIVQVPLLPPVTTCFEVVSVLPSPFVTVSPTVQVPLP